MGIPHQRVASFLGDEILLNSGYANFQVETSSKNTTKEKKTVSVKAVRGFG